LAQVKTRTSDDVKPEDVGESSLNGLQTHTLKGAAKVDIRTINYWKCLGLPAFLFIIIDHRSNGESRLECYYKRYTPLLDGHASKDDNNGTKLFYHVNNRATFLAFDDTQNETGGFARDLIIDYARLSYSKGHIVQLTPRQLGFWPFPDKETPDALHWFPEVAKWHWEKIKETCEWTTDLLARLPAQSGPKNKRT
jgi:hypothetical protein